MKVKAFSMAQIAMATLTADKMMDHAFDQESRFSSQAETVIEGSSGELQVVEEEEASLEEMNTPQEDIENAALDSDDAESEGKQALQNVMSFQKRAEETKIASQVVNNLIHNAIKFTEKGEVSINVRKIKER